MTATLDDIHRDPGILDQAIARGERLEILTNGEVAATLVPIPKAAEPDFLARAKRIWGDLPPGTPLSEIVAASRG
jgi:antitoxin (DNA-binding transcriptional repressor) of toxin-antitoxin stability system